MNPFKKLKESAKAMLAMAATMKADPAFNSGLATLKEIEVQEGKPWQDIIEEHASQFESLVAAQVLSGNPDEQSFAE